MTGKHVKRIQNTLKTRNNDGEVIHREYNVVDKGLIQKQELTRKMDRTAVSVGRDYILGLQSNGRVIATGNNEFGQCDVEDWKL